MRKTEEREIDGLRFKVQQLPGMKGTLLLHRLTGTLGVALLKSLSGVELGKAGAGLKELDLGKVGEGMQSLFERFSSDDLERLIRELNETTFVTIEGREGPLMPVFDNVMAGRPETVFKLLKFALEVNFRNFLDVLLAGAKRLEGSKSSASSTSSPDGPASA